MKLIGKMFVVSFAVVSIIPTLPARAENPRDFYSMFISFLQAKPVRERDQKALKIFAQMNESDKYTIYKMGVRYCSVRREGYSRDYIFGRAAETIMNNSETDDDFKEVMITIHQAASIAAEFTICPDMKED